MSIRELEILCASIEDKDARVYTYTDTGDPMDAELHAIPARELVAYKPFWSNVNGYILQ
jgi:hypothetical protein